MINNIITILKTVFFNIFTETNWSKSYKDQRVYFLYKYKFELKTIYL